MMRELGFDKIWIRRVMLEEDYYKVLYMAGQREESIVGQGTQGTDPNLREIIGLVGRIANALESSQNNQQHSQVGESSQVRYAIATDDLTLLERFVKLKPTVFAGGANSDEAEEWISNKEKLFERMQLTPSQKVSLATFYLREDAYGFGGRQLMQIGQPYIPASVRRDRELAFLQLEQKTKTVQEYEKEFTALARHASYLVEGGDRKARKFETGLNPDIQEAIAPLNISDYHEIVDRALNIERTLKFTRAKRAHMSLSRPPVPQWQAGRFPSTSGERKFLRTDMRSMAYTPRPQTQGFMPRPFITGPRPQPRPGVRPTHGLTCTFTRAVEALAKAKERIFPYMSLTNKIRDEATVAESSSWVLEERLPIWPEICSDSRDAVDVIVISGIKERIAEYEKRDMFTIVPMFAAQAAALVRLLALPGNDHLHSSKMKPICSHMPIVMYNILKHSYKSPETDIAMSLTYKIRDEATITESSSWVLEERLPIWPEICSESRDAVDVIVISGIKERIAKYEKRDVFTTAPMFAAQTAGS
ncbi:hypothetical protein RJ640_023657 [Escallonia rubra]|uniref:Retrotransposon gag domain-containing protein n=1 Tax=Escallonia rubra TaxID=112253 RepID=A0AA88RWY2_9ASTE|nr:hypothetical protein RJ640_023657 [Escallonia rubra]